MLEQIHTASEIAAPSAQVSPEIVQANETDEIEAQMLLRKHNLYCGVKLASSGALLVSAWGYDLCEVADVLAEMDFYPDDSVPAIHEVNQKHAWQFDISRKYGRLSQDPLPYPFRKIIDPQEEMDRDTRQTMEGVRYG